MNIQNLIKNSTENDYIDFKSKWYTKEQKINLIHDILCLSNSLSDSKERYIFIGIKENSKNKIKEFFDITTDKNILKAEDIIQILRNYMAVIPGIEVFRININNKNIDVIKITPQNRDLPYVLNKSFEIKMENNKLKKIMKNAIYSRNSSQNTPIDESCEKEIAKELFARQRGEHLPPLERFKMYLENTNGWRLSQNNDLKNYYYNDNYKFKIKRIENENNIRFLSKINCYHEVLVDVGWGVDYWNHHKWAYDDFYTWFNIELWADETLIDTLTIMQVFAKHYFADKGHFVDTFYIPTRDYLGISNIKTKNDILNSYIWKICKILYRCELQSDDVFDNEEPSLILDYLNYDFIKNPSKYIDDNKNWIYKNND